MVAYRNYGGGTYHMSTGVGVEPVRKDPKNVATKFTHRVVIYNLIPYLRRDTVDWCIEHVNSRHHWEHICFPNYIDGKEIGLFSFAKPEDAMAFKLTFVE